MVTVKVMNIFEVMNMNMIRDQDRARVGIRVYVKPFCSAAKP